jgi:hypothetical protein
MPRKNEPQPPAGPTISSEEGIALLRKQISRADELLAGRSGEDEFQNWRRATQQILVDALGAGHRLAEGAEIAGAQRRVITEDDDEVEMLREQVRRQARALEPCIEHLEREAARRGRPNAQSTSDDRVEGSHDRALVCRKGHLINDAMRSSPEYNTKFCEKCGAATISECPACRHPIQGLKLGGAVRAHLPGPAAYCHDCGAPFPWTEASRRALSDLLAMSGASEAEQAALRDSLPALAADSPETPVAVAKWRKFLAGAGKQMASGLKDVLVAIATEAVKGKIFGP